MKLNVKTFGLACGLYLTYGSGPLSRAVTWAWARLFKAGPGLVGCCRPVRLTEYLDRVSWRITHHNVLSAYGVSSEIAVAEMV